MAKLRKIAGLEELQVELRGIFNRLSGLINQYFKFFDQTESLSAQAGEGVVSCAGYLRSIGNVMLLVRLPEAHVFCRTLEDVCHRLIATQRPNTQLCEKLGFGVIVLQRYVDFVTREQRSVPPLLIPFVNDVRKALRKKPLEEGFFTRLSLEALAKRSELPPQEPDVTLLVQGRHAYQRGLIYVLRGDRRGEGLFIMKKVVASLVAAYHNTPIGVLWDAMNVVLTGLAQGWLRMTHHRRELLGAVDRVLYRLTIGDFNSQSLLQVRSILRDLLFLSALCQDHHVAAKRLAQTFGVDDVHFDDSFLARQRRALLGPDFDTYTRFFEQIGELIAQIRQLTTQQIGSANPDNHASLKTMFASVRSLFVILDADTLCSEISVIEASLGRDDWGDDIALSVVELLVKLEHDIGYRQLVLKPNDYIGRARPDLIHAKNVSAFFLVSAQKTVLEEVLLELKKIISSVERVEHSRGLSFVNWSKIILSLSKSANVLMLIDLIDFSRGMSRLARNLASLIDIQLAVDRPVMEYWATGLAALEYYCMGLLSPKEGSQRALAMIATTLKSMWLYVAKERGSKHPRTFDRLNSTVVDSVRLAELG